MYPHTMNLKLQTAMNGTHTEWKIGYILQTWNQWSTWTSCLHPWSITHPFFGKQQFSHQTPDCRYHTVKSPLCGAHSGSPQYILHWGSKLSWYIRWDMQLYQCPLCYNQVLGNAKLIMLLNGVNGGPTRWDSLFHLCQKGSSQCQPRPLYSQVQAHPSHPSPTFSTHEEAISQGLTWSEVVDSHLQVGKLVWDVTALVHSTQGQNIETSNWICSSLHVLINRLIWVSVITGLDYWTHPTP